ncbi:MAG TPA: PGPGW domain-containing protein [Burkholderiales bacterium]|nr:PGPGW domain-containing protein [Burkholderiales bacterium]
MIDTQSWDRFVHALPGRRFQERYRRKQREQSGAWKRCAFVIAGIALSLVGILFMAIPGPGIPILALGLALVAQESAVMARFLDRAEIRLRRLWKRLRA